MDGFNGRRAIGAVFGGLAMLGVLIWQAIHCWMAWSKEGGTTPLALAIACTLLVIGLLALAAKMLL